jgi:replication factor C large subunit
VRATQNYSYWRYATDNIAAGVAAARDRNRGGWTRYGGAPYRSSRDSTRDYVAERVAEREGVSVATARREVLPFLSAMTAYCRNRELTVAMAARYDLDAEHVAFVTGSGKSTNKVASVVEDAERRREEAAVEGSGGAFAPGDDDTGSEEADPDAPGDDDATGGSAEQSGERAPEEDDEDEKGEEESDQQSGLSDFL